MIMIQTPVNYLCALKACSLYARTHADLCDLEIML